MSNRQPSSSLITTRAGQKRKAESEPGIASSVSSAPPSATSLNPPESSVKRLSVPRTVDFLSDQPSSSRAGRSQLSTQAGSDAGRTDEEAGKPTETRPSVHQGKQPIERRIAEVSSRSESALPAGKVFPIQVGSEIFRLSGASISSDAPSYFSHYFGEQIAAHGGAPGEVNPLYIDRDPGTFKDISLHLQGYYVKPRDGEHFVRLFADAQFYSLPRLTQQLFKSEIFIQVGDRHFQIPRDTFSSPGDSPNFFTLGFAHFFSTPSEVFPGLDRQTLLRPPSILPPAIASRSGDVFADLLKILQGYDVHIRDPAHRAELLRDARYFHLKGVEQKLTPCDVSFNAVRERSELTIRLDDVRQSGVGFHPDRGSVDPTTWSTSKPGTPHSAAESPTTAGWITYQRPYVDDTAHDLVLELCPGECTRLDVGAMRAAFSGSTNVRIASLFSVIANKLNLPAMMPLGLMLVQSGGGLAAQPASPANSGVSAERVRVRVERDAFVELDGAEVQWAGEERGEPWNGDSAEALPRVSNWIAGRDLSSESDWVIRRAQWRLRVERVDDLESPGRVEVVLCAVRLEGYTREVARNRHRPFLAA